MNIPTPDDVATAVIAQLASPQWTGLVPNGVSYGRRRQQQTPGSYAIIMIEEQSPANWQSDGTYTQVYAVELTVWTTSSDTVSAQTQPLRQYLDSKLGFQAGDPSGGISVPNAVKTLSVTPSGGGLKLSDDLRNSQDVMAAAKKFDVMIQGKTY